MVDGCGKRVGELQRFVDGSATNATNMLLGEYAFSIFSYAERCGPSLAAPDAMVSPPVYRSIIPRLYLRGVAHIVRGVAHMRRDLVQLVEKWAL